MATTTKFELVGGLSLKAVPFKLQSFNFSVL